MLIIGGTNQNRRTEKNGRAILNSPMRESLYLSNRKQYAIALPTDFMVRFWNGQNSSMSIIETSRTFSRSLKRMIFGNVQNRFSFVKIAQCNDSTTVRTEETVVVLVEGQAGELPEVSSFFHGRRMLLLRKADEEILPRPAHKFSRTWREVERIKSLTSKLHRSKLVFFDGVVVSNQTSATN